MNRHDRTLKRVREMNTNFFPFLSRADGGQDIKMRTAPLYDAVNGSAITCRPVIKNAVASTCLGSMQLISTGGTDANTGAPITFAFVGGHSNLLQLDRLGNLWIGDDSSDGTFNFTGRIWYISAGALSNIP